MYIKLEYKTETKKAYQLLNGEWIPKSILDSTFSEPPFYKIMDWWIEKEFFNDEKEINEKLGEELTRMTANGVPLKYQKEYDTSPMIDYEPYVWGNDVLHDLGAYKP